MTLKSLIIGWLRSHPQNLTLIRPWWLVLPTPGLFKEFREKFCISLACINIKENKLWCVSAFSEVTEKNRDDLGWNRPSFGHMYWADKDVLLMLTSSSNNGHEHWQSESHMHRPFTSRRGKRMMNLQGFSQSGCAYRPWRFSLNDFVQSLTRKPALILDSLLWFCAFDSFYQNMP